MTKGSKSNANMPYRRRSFRTKRRYRRSYVPKRTGRKIVRSYLRRKAKKGNTTVFKLKSNYRLDVSTLQAGIVGSLVNPFFPIGVPGGTGITGTSYATDLAAMSELYDSFKVCAVKVMSIPYQNVTLYDTSGPVFLGYQPLYMSIDYDNLVQGTGASIPTIDDLEEYENCKIYNTYKPWKRYMRVPKYSSNPTVIGANNIPTVQLAKGGYYDFETAPRNGVWYLRMADDPGATETSSTITLRLTLYIACKNRK